MPSIRERVGKFHVQVRMRGFPARTASFPTRRQAERWAKTIEAEMIEGKHFRSSEARRRTVSAAIDRYLLEVAPAKASAGARRTHLAWWKQQIGTLRLAEVTPAVLTECRSKLAHGTYTRARPKAKRSGLKGKKAPEYKRTPATTNRYIATLSHLFKMARKEWHWLAHNPFDGVSKLGEGKGRVRFLSHEERERLLAQTAKNPMLHTFVVLALSTAARAGELQNLIWRDVELNEGRLLLRLTKNAQPRTAWVHGEALRLLKEYAEARARVDDQRVFTSITGKVYRYDEDFSTACEAGEVKGFRFHDLRHSAATYLAREGATEQQLKAIGGWKSNVVSRYVHLAAEDAKAVVERMNAKILTPKPSEECPPAASQAL
jgi:integrase